MSGFALKAAGAFRQATASTSQLEEICGLLPTPQLYKLIKVAASVPHLGEDGEEDDDA